MRKLSVFLILILFILGRPDELFAQRILIKMNDATEVGHSIASIKKLSFNNGLLVLNHNEGTTDTYSISEIQKLYFNLETSAIGNSPSDKGLLSVYPNPANKTIIVDNIPHGTETIFVYNLNGALVLKQDIDNVIESIDISSLPKGLFILRAQDLNVKIIKL
ncbi:MAG: T9SS type A sorting domain-containing protein [Bacteroidales bacterium]|nr:T9SS type A sorting domain-containing protein [Bacteroidales bacterium]